MLLLGKFLLNGPSEGFPGEEEGGEAVFGGSFVLVVGLVPDLSASQFLPH